MPAKLCPVSNMPIDVMHYGDKAFQVVSHRGKWHTHLYGTSKEAMEFRAAFDLRKEAPKAARETDERTGKVRLNGGTWATSYMTEDEMGIWFDDLGPTETTRQYQRRKDG